MEKQENRICVLESYSGGYVRVSEFVLVESSYYYNAVVDTLVRTKAEAILKYDMTGRKEPLYDNTGKFMKWSYFHGDIRRMKRIR